MKKIGFLFWVYCFVCCTHKAKEEPVIAKPVSSSCQYTSSKVVSFSRDILPILKNNCGDCHTTPGSGGIDLDNYSNIKTVSAGGELITVVSNTDPNNIMMPPPPLHHLDSCQIKAINLWISQGYLDN